jgi:hypothetical protein
MLRLSHNPVLTNRYSMFAAEQCPKALAWMASLALAAGQKQDASAWMTELIGALVFVKTTSSASATRELRDSASMS